MHVEFRFLLLCCLLAGCDRPASMSQKVDPGHGDPSVTVGGPHRDSLIPIEDPIPLPTGEFAIFDPDPAEAVFRAEFARLAPLSAGRGLLLFAPGVLEVVDKPQSGFPEDHPFWVDTTVEWMDDQILARIPAIRTTGRPAYLAHSFGGSGDPMYYLVGEDGKRIGSSVDGDLLVIPAEGDAWIYQRTNSMYARRRRIRIDSTGVYEVPTRVYPIGLRTIALGSFHLRRSITDSTVMARVVGGDSVVVVEADDIAENTTPAFRVRTTDGVEGWVRISGAQCNLGLIKGLCWWGD